MRKWIYYRIYAHDVLNWYERLLNEIVKPFAKNHRKDTQCIWFNCYYPKYLRDEPCETKFKKGTTVRYIRLRILTIEEKASMLEKELLKLVTSSSTALDKEKCEFRAKEILSNEFGTRRSELSIKYLNLCSEIVLSLLDESKLFHDKYAERFRHYFCNMLRIPG